MGFIRQVRQGKAVVLTALAISLCLPAAGYGQTADDRELVALLRAGALNIYFRHAQTDWSQNDQVYAKGDWTSCNPERIRQLADKGRKVARVIGKALQSLRLPVTKVFTSPYCRAAETARLFGLGPVEITNDVMNLRVADHFGGREATVDRARRRLSRFPPAGAIHLYVAHGNLSREALSVYPAEAGAVVLKPDPSTGLKVAATLHPDDWVRLAEHFGE